MNIISPVYKFSALLLITVALISCKKNSETASSGTDIQEYGQQVGDVMASIDEAGGSTGTISYNEQFAAEKLFARALSPSTFDFSFITGAQAVSCFSGSTFGSCVGGTTLTRTFGGCTVGIVTVTGTVVFVWSNNNNCVLGATGDSITRTPNFTITGRRGATLTVSKSGSIGQRLTWQSGAGINKVFAFSNDGIRRVFSISGGDTFLDFTTHTTSDITVTGTLRTNRVINGGSLRVTNNISGNICDYAPSNITWSAGCNCATSGNWSGACTDGTNTALVITGCGTAALTVGSRTENITFDRCGS